MRAETLELHSPAALHALATAACLLLPRTHEDAMGDW